jgi:hypothetical protein
VTVANLSTGDTPEAEKLFCWNFLAKGWWDNEKIAAAAAYVVFLTNVAPTDQGGGKRRSVIARNLHHEMNDGRGYAAD